MDGHGGSRSEETTQSLRRRTVRRVEETKAHPRESFDEAISRLLVDHAALTEIQSRHPDLVANARRAIAEAPV